MAKADISIVGGDAVTPRQNFYVDDRTTSSASATIKPGEPVKLEDAAGGNNFALLLATGEPNVTSTTRFVGIAEDESDETSAADGSVNVAIVVPYITKLRCKAHTGTNINTVAKIKLLTGDAVTFDLTSSKFTVNEDEGDDPNDHGLVMVDFDIEKGLVDFYVKPLTTLLGNSY